MAKLNVAIIGFGRMGITHFSIINTHPRVNVTAVADTSSTILSLLTKYVGGVRTYTDHQELLDRESLDAIVVCTPPSLHYEIADAAAARNIHVFCEKPFTTNASHALNLATTFTAKGLRGQVGYVNRFNDVFKRVKLFLEYELIGNPVRFKSEMYSPTVLKRSGESNWRGSRQQGGGALFEVASHAIDLVNLLLGAPDKITGSYLSSIYSANVEDAVLSTFLYKNGSSGSINVNWSDSSYRKPTNKIELFGEKGKIIADQHALKIFLNDGNEDNKLVKGWNTLNITDVFTPVPFYVRGNEFTAQLYHFVDCIGDATIRNESSFREAAITMSIIDGIYQDYNSNGRI